MWGAIGRGLKKVAGVLPFASDALGGVVGQAARGQTPQWLFPVRHLINLFKKKKPEAGAGSTTASGESIKAAPYGDELTSPDNVPAAPSSPHQPGRGENAPEQKASPATAQNKKPAFSVTFSAPEQTSMPEQLPIDSMGMLQLNPYRMNRRRRMRGAPQYNDEG